MNITNRALTINQDLSTGNAECIAGCTVELSTFETAALLNPWHGGFTLRCELLAIDPGTDKVIFVYPTTKTFKNIVDILGVNQVFRQKISTSILNEDAGGEDEIKARFTLLDNSNGQRVIKRSNMISMIA